VTDPGEAIRENNALWDEWTRIHETSKFYDLEGFKRGGVRIRQYELDEIGPVRGKDLLHLQCHFGIDTLSWARLGANVTGVDFSQAAIELARSVAEEIGHPEARFVRSDLYELPDVLDAEFDLVYTSRGALGWLPDIQRWAQVAARFVRPGGRFYVTEIHPVVQALENDGVAPGEIVVRYPYWEHVEPMSFPVIGTYADREAEVGAQTEHGWNHGLGEIVSALIDAGLRIDSLREYPFVDWPIDFLVETDDGTWRLPPSVEGELPLFFSILASKTSG
jgi:ubiquinone/menaquinone biosynthesis C-methylase UbiE